MVPVDNSAAMTGYVTYDLRVTSEYDWTAAAMLLDLSVGSIYQEPEGWGQAGVTFGPPDPVWYPSFPTAEFDTYLVGSDLTTAIAGAGGDVGGDAYRFDTQELDASWYNNVPGDIGTITIGRVTVTDGTAGNLSIMLTNKGKDATEFDVTITPGAAPLVSQIVEESVVPAAPATPERAWTMPTGWEAYFYTAPTIAPRPTYLSPGDLYQRRLENWELYPERRSRNITFSEDGNYFVFLPEPIDEPEDDNLPNTLPEPGTLLLIGAGLGVAMLRRRSWLAVV